MPAAPGKAYRGWSMEGMTASWYAGITGKNRAEFARDAARIAARVPGGGQVLEVAPGPGYFAIELARLGSYCVQGLDISRSFVEIATENARAAGVDVAFVHGNASAMPFADGQFDFLYCRAAFKNFSQPVAAIAEMHRVLRPGGMAVIFDLRPDASLQEIRTAVDGMRLGPINALITRWTFRHMLLRRAWSADQLRAMVAQTPFRTCDIELGPISLEIALRKSSAKSLLPVKPDV